MFGWAAPTHKRRDSVVGGGGVSEVGWMGETRFVSLPEENFVTICSAQMRAAREFTKIGFFEFIQIKFAIFYNELAFYFEFKRVEKLNLLLRRVSRKFQ